MNSSCISMWDNFNSFRYFDDIIHHICLEASINTPALWCCATSADTAPALQPSQAGLWQDDRGGDSGRGVRQPDFGITSTFASHQQSQPPSSPGSARQQRFVGFVAEVKLKRGFDGRQDGTLRGDFYHDLEGRL